jgi:hypothetical protein
MTIETTMQTDIELGQFLAWVELDMREFTHRDLKAIGQSYWVMQFPPTTDGRKHWNQFLVLWRAYGNAITTEQSGIAIDGHTTLPTVETLTINGWKIRVFPNNGQIQISATGNH